MTTSSASTSDRETGKRPPWSCSFPSLSMPSIENITQPGFKTNYRRRSISTGRRTFFWTMSGPCTSPGQPLLYIKTYRFLFFHYSRMFLTNFIKSSAPQISRIFTSSRHLLPIRLSLLPVRRKETHLKWRTTRG